VGNDLLYDASRAAPPDTARALFPDLAGLDLRPPVAARARADVAKTIYYRRRKGTVPMLEELARDVTGWPAHAVEFFQRLGWTQHVEHRRPQHGWVDVRSVERMDRLGGAFDEASRTVDVRQIAQLGGWPHVPNVGFFLWRLASYPLRDVPARRASQPWRYHFSPLGNPAPLFTRWRREGDEAGLATELHVPGPLRRALFHDDLARYAALAPPRPAGTDLYGPFAMPADPLALEAVASLFVVRNGVPVGPAQDPDAPAAAYRPQVVCRRLDPWPANPPAGRVIAVDVARGRLAVGDGWGDETTRLDVSFHYVFAANLGGGAYERRAWLVRPELATLRARVQHDGTAPPDAPPPTHTSVAAALADWAAAGRPNALITILDSRTYTLPGAIQVPNDGWLAIEAANGERPLLQTAAGGLEIQVLPPAVPTDPDRRGALTLSGVVLEGSLRVAGDLGTLRLLHATLVPGRALTETGEPAGGEPSLEVAAGAPNTPLNAQLRVEVAFSILGALRAPSHAAGVWLLDSIVDGLDGTALGGPPGSPATDVGPPLVVERATIFGAVRVQSLDASETIFAGPIESERTQDGCVRFSYVPPGSRVPRRYRCQPELAVAQAVEQARVANPALTPADEAQLRGHVERGLVPTFAARRYGQPAYAQLHLGCTAAIRTGAEDGAEMGAYCHLKQPQRESNLRVRLREYLPFGLDAGILYVT